MSHSPYPTTAPTLWQCHRKLQFTAHRSRGMFYVILKIFCDAARHADRRQGFLILQSNIVTLTSNIEFTDVFTFTFLKVVCQIYTFISRFIRYTLLIPFGPPLFFLTSLILCANRVLETKIRDFGSTLLQIYSTPRPWCESPVSTTTQTCSSSLKFGDCGGLSNCSALSLKAV